MGRKSEVLLVAPASCPRFSRRVVNGKNAGKMPAPQD